MITGPRRYAAQVSPQIPEKQSTSHACAPFILHTAQTKRRTRGPPAATVRSTCQGMTTTGVPIFTRAYKSITSELCMRMQPKETKRPIEAGSLVP